MERKEVPKFLYEFHDGFCGGRFVVQIVAKEFLTRWYYWPILLKDTYYYCKKCEVCEAYANKLVISGELHSISSFGQFEKWDINLMGPLPVIKRGFDSL
jgi:hypothetical protein